MQSSLFTLITAPYTKASIPLGSLLSDRTTPSQDLHTPGNRVAARDCHRDSVNNFDTLDSKGSQSWFTVMLSHFMSLGLQKERDCQFQVVADSGARYLLKEPIKIFRSLVSDEEVKKWLQNIHSNGGEAWFVVGVRTFTNAKLYRRKQTKTQASGMVQPHIDATSAASIGVGTEFGLWALAKCDVDFRGERIFAIYYRRVNIKVNKTTSNAAVVKATLKRGNCWKPFDAIRGPASRPGSDFDEYFEAEISDADEIKGCFHMGHDFAIPNVREYLHLRKMVEQKSVSGDAGAPAHHHSPRAGPRTSIPRVGGWLRIWLGAKAMYLS